MAEVGSTPTPGSTEQRAESRKEVDIQTEGRVEDVLEAVLFIRFLAIQTPAPVRAAAAIPSRP